jgi:O-antigen/teichoic acid export membrane protein
MASWSGSSLRDVLVRGGVALGAASAVQRVLGFVGAWLAARIAGPGTFGAYAIGLATAGMVAGYLGLGIGSTATRFVAETPRGSSGYRTLLTRIALFASVAAVAGFVLLFAAAEPAAAVFLGDAGYGPLVRAAAVSVVGLILVDALNGVLMGLFSFRSVLWLSGLAGTGTVVALAAGARHGAPTMLAGQGIAAVAAVLITVAIERRVIGPLAVTEPAVAPSRSRLLGFGLTQLGATLGVGLAGWWVALMVVRSDPGLLEMGYYGVASQFRALVTMAPTQISALVMPLLARHSRESDGHARVITSSTLLCSAMAVAIGGAVLMALPLVLAVYGSAYEGAAAAAGLLTATAVVHMSSAPAINSLMVVDLRAFTWINASGALVLAGLATLWGPSHGASGAALAWLVTHVLSLALACRVLHMRGSLTPGLAGPWLLGAGSILLLTALALAAARRPEFAWGWFGLEAGVLAGAMLGFAVMASRLGYLPTWSPWTGEVSRGSIAFGAGARRGE